MSLITRFKPVASLGSNLTFLQSWSSFPLNSTFEFEQLVSQLGPGQVMDAVRNRVLVVQRLVAGVHDGRAVQQSDVTTAVVERKKRL